MPSLNIVLQIDSPAEKDEFNLEDLTATVEYLDKCIVSYRKSLSKDGLVNLTNKNFVKLADLVRMAKCTKAEAATNVPQKALQLFRCAVHRPGAMRKQFLDATNMDIQQKGDRREVGIYMESTALPLIAKHDFLSDLGRALRDDGRTGTPPRRKAKSTERKHTTEYGRYCNER